jgi:DNA polymerase III subunit epsilon
MRQIFLDTETTGLSAENGDRVIEIGCVELLHRKLTGNNLHFYLNPERDSHEDKPKFAEVVDQFLEYIEGAEVIIHNAPFDVGFLNKELELQGRPRFTTFVDGITDTLVMAKEMFPGKRNSLDSLCDRLEVDNSGRTLHGALLDAELLADVYINMTRGQDALLMEVESKDEQTRTTQRVDLSSYQLPVITATEQEMTQHDDVLAQLDKSSGGKTVWRNLQNSVP